MKTHLTETDARIEELCQALDTVIINQEKTHQTLMTRIIKPQQTVTDRTVQEGTRDMEPSHNRRSTETTVTSRQSNSQIPKNIKFASNEDITAFINNLRQYAKFVHSSGDLCDLFPLTHRTGPVSPMHTSTSMVHLQEASFMKQLYWREFRIQRRMSTPTRAT